jgi:hypothetical protein
VPTKAEDQPWYAEWHQALERVISAQMARDSTQAGTPQREIAEREYQAALAVFRSVAEQIRQNSP